MSPSSPFPELLLGSLSLESVGVCCGGLSAVAPGTRTVIPFGADQEAGWWWAAVGAVFVGPRPGGGDGGGGAFEEERETRILGVKALLREGPAERTPLEPGSIALHSSCRADSSTAETDRPVAAADEGGGAWSTKRTFLPRPQPLREESSVAALEGAGLARLGRPAVQPAEGGFDAAHD